MAHTEKLEEAILETIAHQVGDLFPRLLSQSELGAEQGELGETFSVWLITAEDVRQGNLSFEKLPQNTGRWHSQVRIGGRARIAARSTSLGDGPENWLVRQIIEGDVAEAIDETIDWVDENIEGDPLARVIEVPSYHITALWLTQDLENSVVIARCPITLRNLRRLTLYSGSEFSEMLREEETIVGIR